MRKRRYINRRTRTLSDWPTRMITFAVALFCWAVSWHYSVGLPVVAGDAAMPLWKLASRIFVYDVTASFAGLFSYLLIAFIMQRISDMSMFVTGWNCLSMLLFVLLAGTNAGLHPLNETTAALICAAITMHTLLSTYQQPEAIGQFFNAGVLIGLAGLIVPQMVWFAPFALFGMYRLRSITLRGAWVLLVGLLTVYWIILGWCVWTHDFSILIQTGESLARVGFASVDKSFLFQRPSALLILTLLIVVFYDIKIAMFRCSAVIRRKLVFLLDLCIFLLALSLLYGDVCPDLFWALISLPATLLIASYLESLSSTFFRFTLYYLVLAIMLASYLFQVWNF